MAPERIRLVTEYILSHFDQKTYRGDKTYTFNVLQNIAEVAAAGGRDAIEEVKRKQRVSGFNSIFAVSSVDAAKLYYEEFKKQMAADPTKHLRVAIIYSYGANEEETDGILDEENSEDTSALDKSSRDFLDSAIADYNAMFHTCLLYTSYPNCLPVWVLSARPASTRYMTRPVVAVRCFSR